MWMSHPGFENLIKESWAEGNNVLSSVIPLFSTRARVWNDQVFGNVFKKKKRVLARLKGIQEAMSNKPSRFLVELLSLRAG